MAVPGPAEEALYSGTLDCAKKTIVKEGITGLYKGLDNDYYSLIL